MFSTTLPHFGKGDLPGGHTTQSLQYPPPLLPEIKANPARSDTILLNTIQFNLTVTILLNTIDYVGTSI